jgi:hypothetical protein
MPALQMENYPIKIVIVPLLKLQKRWRNINLISIRIS